jgi:sugar phosphate isomerase/epimerase
MCLATLLVDPMTASDAAIRVAADACVAAGCTDLSVWAHQIAPLGEPGRLGGVRIVAVEAALAWAGTDAGAAADEARYLAGLAARYGATRIGAVTMEPTLPDPVQAGNQLGLLAEAAGDAGAVVCVEFLPWSGIPSLAAAWRLVAPLGPAVTVLLDTWHWQRQPGGPDLDLLATIPGDRIAYVQLCDAAARPTGDSLSEAMSARLLPGDGVVDFAAVVGMLDRIGARPFVATEIFNPSLVAERGAAAAAVAMADAGRKVLESAGSP